MKYEECSLDQLYDALETVDEMEDPGLLELIEERINILEAEQNKPEKFEDSFKLTYWVNITLGLQIVISFIAFAANFSEYQILIDLKKGNLLPQDHTVLAWDNSKIRQSIIQDFHGSIYTISAILILIWIYHVSRNAHQLSNKKLTFTPIGSIGWYFVPFVNFWMPYQAMKEIWQVSHSLTKIDAPIGTAILRWWWLFWVCSCLFGSISFQSPIDQLSSTMTNNIMSQTFNLASIPLAIVFMVIVNKIQNVQKITPMN